MDNLDQIVAKITKLMSLTVERGATEAEATLAAEHVQRLLAEHNLSMSAVEASGGSSGDSGKREQADVAHRQVYKWQQTLMFAVAELNYCRCMKKYASRGWGRPEVFDGYRLIGRVANVASTRAMFEYLLQTAERLAREDVGDPSKFFTRYAHSFKEGVADRVVERLRERQEAMMREQETAARAEAAKSKHPAYSGSGLPAVILRDVIQDEKDLNRDFAQNLAPGTTARERREREERYERDRVERVAKVATRTAELLCDNPGMDPALADWLASGYSQESWDKFNKPVRPETEAQRRKREERERNDHYRQRAREDRAAQRLDHAGYRKGRQKGEEVGLDRQVGRGGSSKRIG